MDMHEINRKRSDRKASRCARLATTVLAAVGLLAAVTAASLVTSGAATASPAPTTAPSSLCLVCYHPPAPGITLMWTDTGRTGTVSVLGFDFTPGGYVNLTWIDNDNPGDPVNYDTITANPVPSHPCPAPPVVSPLPCGPSAGSFDYRVMPVYCGSANPGLQVYADDVSSGVEARAAILTPCQ
jgi:hypothetical protein